MLQKATVRLRQRRIVAAGAISLVLAGGFLVTEAAWADSAVSVSPASGGSGTAFTINIPGTAKCSGDTATDGYHVYSYVVPSSVNPTTLNFAGGAANQGQALIDTGGTPYDSEATGVASGSVPTLPQFSWAPYVGDFGAGHDLLPGTWNVGIACAKPDGSVDGSNFWNYQFTFAAGTSAGDFTWIAAAAAPPPTTSTTSTTTSSATTTTVPGTSTTLGGGTTTTSLPTGATTTVFGAAASGSSGSESGTGSGGSGGGSGASPAADPSTTAALAATGAPVTRQAVIGGLLVVAGLFVLSFAYSSRPNRGAHNRRS
jgi:hypothetical protein